MAPAAIETTAAQTTTTPALGGYPAEDQTTEVQELEEQVAANRTIVVRTTPPASAPALGYDDPRAIYKRYVAAREAWYKTQPRGSVKTNQQYRKAMGLPQRYDKASYRWCLDRKQMSKRCRTSTVNIDWTKEEMMAYLDWNKAEDDRVEARVAAEMEQMPFSSRRSMGEIWEAAARDIE
jgi:hypothetical protein